MSETQSLFLIGLVTGGLLGIAARWGRFCSLGAVEDMIYGGNYDRSFMWVSTIGYSLLGMGALLWLGWFDLDQSLYLRFLPNFPAHIIGGLLFGYGMALAGMCGFTALARLGSGDLRAIFIVLVIGISSYICSSGLLSPLRSRYFRYTPISDQPIPSFASWTTQAEWLFLILGAGLALVPLLRANYRRSLYPIWSILAALGIVGGWAGTYWVSTLSFEPITVESHTFSLPLGETILYSMLSSAEPVNFSIGSVVGVALGALLSSLVKQEFHWEACDDARELLRQISGAFLMGIGAVIAFGCSIGQGLSAMAVLSYGALVTLLCIFLGAYIGLKYLIEG